MGLGSLAKLEPDSIPLRLGAECREAGVLQLLSDMHEEQVQLQTDTRRNCRLRGIIASFALQASSRVCVEVPSALSFASI